MRGSIIVLFLLVSTVCSNALGQEANSELQGDWYTADGSNILMLSLQDGFVLYDSEFWDYELLAGKEIQLRNQESTKKLAYTWVENDLVLTIENKPTRLARERKPDTRQRPTTNLDLREDFLKIDQVVLHGVITPIDTMPLVASVIYNDAFQESQQKFSADIDEKGRFKLIFPLNNAQDIYFRAGGIYFSFYARPSGKMAMKIDENSFREGTNLWTDRKEISFMGDLAQINEEYRLLHPEFMSIRNYEENDSLQKALTSTDYLKYRLRRYQEQSDFFNGYFREYPTSDAMKDLSLRGIRVNAAEDLMRYIWLHNMKSGRIDPVDVSNDYLRQVTALMPDDVLDFSAGNYAYLNREFTMVMMPREANALHDKRLAATYDFLSNSVVSENSKMVLSKWKEEEASREKHFGYLSFKGGMKPIYDQYEDDIKDLNNKVNWDHLMSKASNFSMVQRSSMVATYLSQNYHTRGVEIPEYIVEKLENADLLPLIAERINEQISDFDLLKNTEFVEGIEIASSSDNILAELKEKHKGKVVYIDVWATWCGPCITEFSYLKELKANKLKDVVYVYLCGQSAKKTFDLMVKKHELVGENYFLDKEAYSRFDKEVNITGFPTYMVITKEGKLVREGVKRPSAREDLVKQLKEFAARGDKR